MPRLMLVARRHPCLRRLQLSPTTRSLMTCEKRKKMPCFSFSSPPVGVCRAAVCTPRSTPCQGLRRGRMFDSASPTLTFWIRPSTILLLPLCQPASCFEAARNLAVWRGQHITALAAAWYHYYNELPRRQARALGVGHVLRDQAWLRVALIKSHVHPSNTLARPVLVVGSGIASPPLLHPTRGLTMRKIERRRRFAVLQRDSRAECVSGRMCEWVHRRRPRL